MAANSTARFTCRVIEGYGAVWRFRPPTFLPYVYSGSTADSITVSLANVHSFGYAFDMVYTDLPSYQRSVLTVTFNEGPNQHSLNQTIFICEAFPLSPFNNNYIRSQFRVTVYGTL